MFPSDLSALTLHHIGIAVKDISTARGLYSAMNFQVASSVLEDPIQRVRVQFIQSGTQVLIELVEPTQPDSPVSNFLRKRGPGFHHLCYEVNDIWQMCEYVRNQGGLVTCEPVPAVAFQGKLIAFVYWHQTLIEFLELGDPLHGWSNQ